MFPRAGRQHQVGAGRERGARVVGQGDGGGSAFGRGLEGLGGVLGLPGVGDGQGHITGPQQGRRGERRVPVAPDEGHPAYAVQLLVQILADERAGPHAEDIDPAGLGHRVHRPAQRVDVECGARVLQGPHLVVDDLADYPVQRVRRTDVGAALRRPLAAQRVLPRGGGRQRQAQLGVVARADRAAEPHHGGRRGARPLRQRVDGQFRDLSGVGEDRVGHPPLRGGQGGPGGADAREDVGERGVLGGRLRRAGRGLADHGPSWKW